MSGFLSFLLPITIALIGISFRLKWIAEVLERIADKNEKKK